MVRVLKTKLFYMYDTFEDTVNKFLQVLYANGGKVLWRPHFVDWARKMGFVIWYEIDEQLIERMLAQYSKLMLPKG